MVADHFTTSETVLRIGEGAFIVLWAVGLLAVARTGSRALRLSTYIGASAFPVLWDWILGQDWLFRLTYDDRLLTAFTIDGRDEPIFAPLAYGLVFGGTTILAYDNREWLSRRLGRWHYPAIFAGLYALDIVAEGFAVSVLRMWVFDYDPSWLIWGVPVTTALFVAVVGTAMVYALTSLSQAIGDRPPTRGIWSVSFLVPSGAAYLGVACIALILNLARPW